MSETLLELQGVTRRFGGLVAVRSLDMEVRRGAIHGLIGPNGAGKSTAFDLISGLTALSDGTVRFDGEDISRRPAEARVKAGICRTFQTPRLFENMTALETVMTGLHRHARCGFWASTFAFGGKKRDEARIAHEAFALLEFLGVAQQAHTVVSQLPYGPRRLVEIARALATRPKLLMLDEVASGLNPVETGFVADVIRRLRADGLTIMLVEHDMRFIMNICDHVTVLNFGARIADAAPDHIATNPGVIEAYLGRPRADALSRRDARRQSQAESQRT